MKIKMSFALTVLSLLLASAPAAATTFKFDTNRAGQRDHSGTHESLSTTFNDETNLLTFSSTFSRNNDKLPNGGWLVLSNGPMPKRRTLEHPIFYIDGINDKVSAYVYDRQLRRHSWKESELLGETDLKVTNDGHERTFDFSFDLSDINSKHIGPDWKGGGFDEKIGIWLHAFSKFDIGYEDGEISHFKHGKRSWLDIANHDTVIVPDEDDNPKSVPEPASTAALGALAAVAAVFTRRHRSA